jgi:iron complex transport system ATP-binding protein
MVATNDCETIRINHLSIGYPGKNAPHIVAKGIQSSLYSGELTCLLGANGAGKSTLLRTLSMFQPSLDGKILLRNKDINDYSRNELATLISVVLTDRCEVEGMTVHELVALGRTPYTDFWGKLSDADEAIVQESIALVGIDNLSKRRISTLSDGERQKAMIAKALAQETPVVLLDEPTAFLDFPSKVEVMQLLRRLSRETNKSILLSTHDLELALQIADKIWLMEKGKELITGTPEDLAIDGLLSHFFQRDGVLFNSHTGLFGVNNPINHHIHIIGSGERFEMARKALRRNGIEADDINSPFTLKVTEVLFQIIHKEEVLAETTTIESLLKTFNRMLQSI